LPPHSPIYTPSSLPSFTGIYAAYVIDFRFLLELTLRQANVLIDGEGVVKLTGFVISAIKTDEESTVVSTGKADSVRWTAPELLRNLENHRGHNAQTDMWAFGMITVEVFTGKQPYSDCILEEAAAVEIIKGRLPTKPLSMPETLWQNVTKNCFVEAPKRIQSRSVESILDTIPTPKNQLVALPLSGTLSAGNLGPMTLTGSMKLVSL
jgi:serine/threonine protein kinase